MKRRIFTVAGLAGFVALLPCYVGESGGLQPCDAALAIMALAVWSRRSGPLEARLSDPARFRSTVMLLALWGMALDLGWYAVTGSDNLLTSAMTLCYSALLVSVLADAWHLLGGPLFLRTAGFASIAGLLTIGCVVLIPAADVASRAVGLFNNPNQLGYYALCAASLTALSRHQRAVSWPIHLVALAAGGLLVVASQSKAAMAGFAALLFCEFPRAPRIVLAAAMLIGLVVVAPAAKPTKDKMASQVSSFGAGHDDSLEARGYPRLWNQPEFLILGAGNGGFDRFSDAFGKAREMHSTIGNFAVSYGLVGLVLGCLALAFAVRGAPLLGLCALLPAALYGLAHNGVRFRAAWLLLVSVAFVCDSVGRAKAAHAPKRSQDVLDGDAPSLRVPDP